MKKLTKLLGIVLILALVMSMGIVAWADDTITININTPEQTDVNSASETYYAYKIFGVTKTNSVKDPVTDDENIGDPVDPDTDTGFSYYITTNDKWWTVVSTAYTDEDAGISYTVSTDATTGVITTSYFTLTPSASDATYYTVALKSGEDANETTAKAIAKMLKARIGTGENAIAYDASLTPGTAATVDAGYYLIDSSLGSNLVLATTNMTITEKNDYPTGDKEILEGSSEVKTTDLNVGDTVSFALKATVPASANQKVVLHDTMDEDALRLVTNSFVVKNGENVVAATNYTITFKNGLTTTTGTYTGTVSAVEDDDSDPVIEDSCTFEVVFTDAYIQSLTSSSNLTVTFDAILTEDALMNDSYQSNEMNLTYSNYTTPTFEVKVYTYEFDIIKYEEEGTTTGYDSKDTLLADATFALKNGSTTLLFVDLGNNVYLYDSRLQSVTLDEDGKNDAVTDPDDSTKTLTVVNSFTTDDTGKITLQGLDAGTYALTELEAPAGYNKLADDIAVVISATGSGTGNEAEKTMTLKQDDATVTQITVNNQTGTVLPSTGGIGTTIFYIVGSVLVIAAGVLLVTKKRMGRD